MKNYFKSSLKAGLAVAFTLGVINGVQGQDDNLVITGTVPTLGATKPIPVSVSGFSGEALAVLKFDLYVQGFSFTTADAAQYQISGSAAGNITGTVMDRVSHQSVLARAYSGASLRREAHFFANDIVKAINHQDGIGLTKIAFKREVATGHSEIYVSDFDGYGAQAVTRDNTLVAAPCWMPGRMAVYYTSYYPGNPDIFYNSLSSGQRSIVASSSDLNTSPAVSPDGTRLAMIMSRSGSPNVWVANADGSHPVKLTSTSEDSSPCWSPDGKWICFATKTHANGRRVLAKVPAGGGEMEIIHTSGMPNPSEPDWSPDGKWIAFTCQTSYEFDICVVPADGGTATMLVPGQDPSWSANSRTLVFTRTGYNYGLSVLDVMTKQVKDIKRTSGTDSQPAWAR